MMTGAGRGFCAGADMRDTFKTRLDGIDPAGDGERSGGMPAGRRLGGRWRASRSP